MTGLAQDSAPPGTAPEGSDAPGPIVLEVDGLSAHAPDGTRLLDDVTFRVEKGSLIGIAGPTGAGKSSLVRVLTGAISATSGRVLVGGVRLDDEPSLRRRIGLVPQENVLHNQLRLRRALGYGAALRLPPDTPANERDGRVGHLLVELGLHRHSSVRIGSLSGGQRQRANVAMEMIADPDILILDEPTSSLDPGYEKTVLRILRRLADRGHSVLTVTHSVAALMECDRVLFLSAGGQQAYFGPPSEALAYFGCGDPSDLFRDLDDVADRRWGYRFRASRDFHRYAAVSGGATPPARSEVHPVPAAARQLLTLVRRGAEQILSDRRHSAMLAVQGAVLGFLLLTFLGADGLTPVRGHPLAGPQLAAVTGVAQLLALTVVWLGLANSVREIVKERRTVEREHSAGLSLRAYLGSKFIVLGSISVIEAAILSVIATARQNAPARGAVLGSGTIELMVALAAAGLASTALGLLLSAVVRSPDKALAGLPVVVVAEFVLSGLQPAVRWVPGLDHLHDLASSYWAIQAVRATVTGRPGAWWTALAAQAVFVVVSLAAGSALLGRGLRPGLRPVPFTPRLAVAGWQRWSHSVAASRMAMRTAAVGLAALVAAGSAVATELQPALTRAALPAPSDPARDATHPAAAASSAGTGRPTVSGTAQGSVAVASPAAEVRVVPGTSGVAGPRPAPAPRTSRTPAEITTAGTSAVPSAAPASASRVPVAQVKADPAGLPPAVAVPPASAGRLPVAAVPPVTPVVATLPTPLSAGPAQTAPVAAVPAPTPATAVPPGSFTPLTALSPLVAAEQAMAAAVAEAWGARVQQAIWGSQPRYQPVPGVAASS